MFLFLVFKLVHTILMFLLFDNFMHKMFSLIMFLGLSASLVWVGGTDEGDDLNWRWEPSGIAVTFTNWVANQPQPGELRNCMSYASGEWFTGICGASTVYLCQIDPWVLFMIVTFEFDIRPWPLNRNQIRYSEDFVIQLLQK